MTPFWNWSALMLPGWLAPNVITMGATISVIVSFLLCASVCHKLECGQASWVHVVRYSMRFVEYLWLISLVLYASLSINYWTISMESRRGILEIPLRLVSFLITA